MASVPPSTRFDLHMHSDRSDGRFAPDEVIARAAKAGLDVIAITDHDLATTAAPGPHQVDEHTVHVIAGAELSAHLGGQEFHVLVYFPGEVPAGFRAYCLERCREREARFRAALAALGAPDVLPADATTARALTRVHMADALVQQGQAASRGDAFGRFLHSNRGVVPSLTTPVSEALQVARHHGGLTVWAHPPADALDQHLSAFVDAGLQGLEVMRPRVAGPLRRRLRRAARQHGLLVTGGSDWHGWGNPDDLGLFRVEAREIPSFINAIGFA